MLNSWLFILQQDEFQSLHHIQKGIIDINIKPKIFLILNISKVLVKRTGNTCSFSDLYMNVYMSFTCNGQKLETNKQTNVLQLVNGKASSGINTQHHKGRDCWHVGHQESVFYFVNSFRILGNANWSFVTGRSGCLSHFYTGGKNDETLEG